MSWQKGREKNGQIKAGQTWKKKDTGRIMIIINKGKGGWCVTYSSGGSNKHHTLNDRVIYKYYDRL